MNNCNKDCAEVSSEYDGLDGFMDICILRLVRMKLIGGSLRHFWSKRPPDHHLGSKHCHLKFAPNTTHYVLIRQIGGALLLGHKII